jgi:hypothetical protein
LEIATGANSGSGNAVAEVISAAQSLAESVGPEWGLAILIVILLFLPKYGVVVHLAQLWKEDRADDRKRKVEADRLMAKYRNRPQIPPPARRLGHEKEKQ